jgi:hypothetical protein
VFYAKTDKTEWMVPKVKLGKMVQKVLRVKLGKMVQKVLRVKLGKMVQEVLRVKLENKASKVSRVRLDLVDLKERLALKVLRGKLDRKDPADLMALAAQLDLKAQQVQQLPKLASQFKVAHLKLSQLLMAHQSSMAHTSRMVNWFT